MFCLWHVFKNVVKNCAGAFADAAERAGMIRLFRSAAYAATPEAFHSYQTKLEEIVAGTKCESYIADLIENKTKWAFSCRPTVLTLGMVATQRVEGLFSVAQTAGVEKKLSLCALWDGLERFNQMLDIEHGRLGTRPIVARKAFQEEDLQTFLDPMEKELKRVGASQYCHREVRDEVGGSTPYDVKIIASGPAAADAYPLPLDGRSLRMAVESCTRGINAI